MISDRKSTLSWLSKRDRTKSILLTMLNRSSVQFHKPRPSFQLKPFHKDQVSRPHHQALMFKQLSQLLTANLLSECQPVNHNTRHSNHNTNHQPMSNLNQPMFQFNSRRSIQLLAIALQSSNCHSERLPMSHQLLKVSDNHQ